MKTLRLLPSLLAALLLTGAASAQSLSLRTGQNLVFNGDFSHPEDPLAGWVRDYPGNQHYARNAEHVSIVSDPMRGNILRIDVPGRLSGPGVKAHSRPIPFDQEARYRFRVRARGTGVPARILLMGYRWPPGADQVENPTVHDLRETHRFAPLHFTSGGAGGVATAPRSWQWAEMTLPDPNLSDRGRRSLQRVEFVAVQLMGIKGTGELFIDEVQLERIP